LRSGHAHGPIHKALIAAKVNLPFNHPEISEQVRKFRFVDDCNLPGMKFDGSAVFYNREHIKSLTLYELQCALLGYVRI
jgi:hypothetical protein